MISSFPQDWPCYSEKSRQELVSEWWDQRGVQRNHEDGAGHAHGTRWCKSSIKHNFRGLSNIIKLEICFKKDLIFYRSYSFYDWSGCEHC